MLKSLFENMPCVTSEDSSEEQEERELYEVAANYNDFGIGVPDVSAKKLADADSKSAQSIVIQELHREIINIEPGGLLDQLC